VKTRGSIASKRSGPKPFLSQGESTIPGAMIFTLICGPSTRANAKLSALRAPFDAIYARLEPPPIKGAIDETLTTAALAPFRSSGANARII
jgi:hypothetical protein